MVLEREQMLRGICFALTGRHVLNSYDFQIQPRAPARGIVSGESPSPRLGA